jgi:Mg2+/citrate symporter
MASIKFGAKQINNPTPRGVILAVRIFTIAAGIFLGWMQTTTFIDKSAQAVISSVLGLALALVNGIAPLFGVDTTQTVIPKKDVAAMSV